MFENQGAWSIDLPEHGVTKSEDSILYLTQITKERAIRKVMGGCEKKKRERMTKKINCANFKDNYGLT